MLDSDWIKVKRVSHKTAIVNGEKFIRDPRSSSRLCTVYSGLMLKLDGATNHGQVLSEVLLWPEIEEEDRKFFVPIVGFGLTEGGEVWLAQELHEPEFAPDGEDSEILYEICSKYEIDDVYPNAHNCNWMWVNGVPKIYDWGLNPRWNDTQELHNNGYAIPQFDLMGEAS